MPRHLLSAVLAGAVLGTANLLCPVPLPAQNTPSAEAGKLIFTKGESPSQSPLEAVLGEGSTTVPGTLMPCASCHGADGRGRPEGGVTPSDITWGVLSRPYRSDESLARRRPAYDAASIRKVLRKGIDPGGNELGVAMPRYNISDADLDSLIAYLKQLGAANDPGLTATSLRAGTVIPASGPMAAAGEGVAALLHAYFDEINQQGGIYGRKIELVVLKVEGTPEEIASQVCESVRSRQVFSLVGILAPGAEHAVNKCLEQSDVPAVDAFATDAEAGVPAKSQVFHVLSGLPQQARVLVKYAQDRPEVSKAKVAVVYPESRKSLANGLIEECRARSCNLAVTVGYAKFHAARMAGSLHADNIGAIFFLGTGRELEELLVAAQLSRSNWRPTVFQPGPLAGVDVFRIPPEFNDRVFFSFPVLLSDINPAAIAEYGRLRRKYKLAPEQPLRALSALAPAKVFAEALKQAGRELGRDKLVETLSTMYNFTTGWTPPVTYSVTRRVGALGAYVVRLNLKNKSFAPVEPWMAP